MELAVEEAADNSNASVSDVEFVHAVVKRQRTKRRRTQPSPPLPLIADSSSASSAETVSGTVTEEEEDMANCLMLLAQGQAFSDPVETRRDDKFTGRRLAGAGKADGGFVYECKTCNKCFPSFQALGGHRTSHKKPKLAATVALNTEENKRNSPVVATGNDNLLRIGLNSSFSAKPKVHECAICGSEFSSGQALGGHMRRHRQLTAADAHADAAKKEKSSFVCFDLNLPAPADVSEPRSPPSSSAFISAGNRPLIFSGPASSLVVNCHY